MNILPFGSWPSPLSAEVALHSTAFRQTFIRPAGDDVIYSEGRPLESGRTALIYFDGVTARDLLPLSYDVRSRVHEYGGAAFVPVPGGVCFVNFEDQCVYRSDMQGEVQSLTLPGPYRHGDLTYDSHRNQLICIRETISSSQEPRAELVAISIESPTTTRILFSGPDFLTSPAISPDGSELSWISWDHPDMPWDNTQIWRARFAGPGLADIRNAKVDRRQAIMEPRWSPANSLFCISDADQWWNIYEWSADSITLHQRTHFEAEIGTAPWFLGTRHFDFVSDATVIVCVNSSGEWHVSVINLATGQIQQRCGPYAQAGQVCANGEVCYFFAATKERPGGLYRAALGNGDLTAAITGPSSIDLNYADALSEARNIDFPTTDDTMSHGIFYPPRLKAFVGEPGTVPPLVILMHGGPTSAASSRYTGSIQYLTSRGIAVLDMNYRGSTGFGRDYRMSLYGRWGIVELDDACSGAAFLGAQGWVDPKRMAIAGGSAGGYSALAAAAFRQVFVAASSHYGVADLSLLERDTHKFESHYIRRLIGPAEGDIDPMISRSPIHSIETINIPLIVFQGLDDPIVPPNQARAIVDSLKARGIEVEYHAFPGESHGFRKAETLCTVIEAEYAFFARIFGVESKQLGRR